MKNAYKTTEAKIPINTLIVTPHKKVYMCNALLFEVSIHKSLMMAQKPETCSLHENTRLCQMVSTGYFLNIMDTLCAYFFSSHVCVCVCVCTRYMKNAWPNQQKVKKKMFYEPRPTEWISDDSYGI